MNIYQKLIEVRKAVPFLKKDSQGDRFKFVSSSKALISLKESMDKHGLLLVPRVTSSEVRDHTTQKGNHEYFTILNIDYTWVNAEKPEETISCPWLGQGLDSGEKGVGKALTYSEKYFLLKFFNIPTDKDDPDKNQGGGGGTSDDIPSCPKCKKQGREDKDKPKHYYCWEKKGGCGHRWNALPQAKESGVGKFTLTEWMKLIEEESGDVVTLEANYSKYLSKMKNDLTDAEQKAMVKFMKGLKEKLVMGDDVPL